MSGGAQYLLPEGLGAAAAGAALAGRLELESGPRRSAERTFYDSFDGRLHAEGLVLVHEERRLALLEASAYSEQAVAERDSPPPRLLAADLPAGRLRDLLDRIAEARALEPLARVRSRRRPLRVLDGDAKTVVRLVLEEPAVAGRGRARVALPPRLIVAPVRGYDDAAARVRRVLEEELGLRPAAEPLHDEAVAASGGTPGGVSSKLRVELPREARADAAAAALLARLLAVIEANLPGTLGDTDSEFLHDLRVAVRRTRSVQRQLRRVFPPEALARYRAEFRWLQQATGPTRDLDVYLLEFDSLRTSLPAGPAGELDPLRRVLAARRKAERARMVRALRSRRATGLLAGWSGFLDALPDSPEHDRPEAARAIGDLAGQRVRAVYGGMLEMGAAIDDSSPPEALHELRKKGKELRYLLELFASVFPGRAAKPMVGALKSLQNTLGRFQDHEVQADVLRSLRDEVAPLEGGPAALMAMGLLVEDLERRQAEARAEFAERFAAFAAKRQRSLVEQAFA